VQQGKWDNYITAKAAVEHNLPIITSQIDKECTKKPHKPD